MIIKEFLHFAQRASNYFIFEILIIETDTAKENFWFGQKV